LKSETDIADIVITMTRQFSPHIQTFSVKGST